ncbi:hypothetical protein F4813DRAFT_370437 [Daldinia decipiens]|uniref:uncharacterized protein n=1 Tax=Daldinia decipiens TaxID=326647 RepID=UPI0020C51223|nr:uncharacterized protein F4813DRAFT_370437 [Daldinia decipiens]KAI1654581.1 hypothetical protein F4813DRAFT_370437 [Daldinia decipiens]
MLRSNSTSFWFGLCLLASTAAAGGAVLKRDDLPTPVTGSESTGAHCDAPTQTTGYPDLNSLCHSPPYIPDPQSQVRCNTKCIPAVASQTLIRPENDSMKSCYYACTGSFEKAKRGELSERQDSDYWFCHGINFIQGELCEFIGSLGSTESTEGGPDCLYMNSLDS